MNRLTATIRLFLLACPLLLLPAMASAENSLSGSHPTPCHDAKLIAQAEPQALSPAEREARRQEWLKKIGITPEQDQKISALRAQGRQQVEALHTQLRNKKQALFAYLKMPNATEAQARLLNNEINDLQRRLSEIRLKTWFAMRSQLTPEQLARIHELRPKSGSHVPRSAPHGAEDEGPGL